MTPVDLLLPPVFVAVACVCALEIVRGSYDTAIWLHGTLGAYLIVMKALGIT